MGEVWVSLTWGVFASFNKLWISLVRYSNFHSLRSQWEWAVQQPPKSNTKLTLIHRIRHQYPNRVKDDHASNTRILARSSLVKVPKDGRASRLWHLHRICTIFRNETKTSFAHNWGAPIQVIWCEMSNVAHDAELEDNTKTITTWKIWKLVDSYGLVVRLYLEDLKEHDK